MDTEQLNAAAHAAWEQKAEFWDSMMGEAGNLFNLKLVAPAAEKLLNLQAGEIILDVACGNGIFARRLVQLGGRVTAVDFSANMLELARAREHADKIRYGVVDAMDEAALLALGKGTFDAVVCNMALMDIADIRPLMRAARQLLKTDTGRFVFTLMHPCFNFNESRFLVESEDRNGELVDTYALKITNYLHTQPQQGAGSPGEPNPHYYFHRPLHVLLNTAFAAGWVMDGIEEPEIEAGLPTKRLLSWFNYIHFPPILAVRLRPR